ncbi:MAG: ABC transporter permease [Firmicutes bacterium]|nr:ABC transporter permease [Candidatus Fermentithermobacillaceae bacterium]
MGRYVLRRLVLTLVALWAIVTITFILMMAVPGSPFNSPKLTPTVRKQLERKYGLDKPLWKQYLILLNQLAHFDFGISIRERGRDVNDIIKERFPASALLGVEALLYAVSLGLTMGVVAALNRGRWPDYVAQVLAIIGASVPNFVVAAFMQWLFAVKLGILPIARWGEFKHTILPAFCLGFGTLATMTRMMRSSTLEVINQDYVRTAKAKGLSSAEITWRHIIRNSILPIVTILGPLTAAITTGTFVVERIFGVPGLGRFYVDSIYNRDYPLIMGTTIFYAILLLFLNFLVDIAYGFIDPRIRLTRGKED